MSKKCIFDIETNGLLRKVSRVHCVGIVDVDTRERFAFRQNDKEDSIPQALEMLEQADLIIGHNNTVYDNQVLKKLYPSFKWKKSKDTLVLARVAFPDIQEADFRRQKAGTLPGKLINSHSLKAWGYRFNVHKGDYAEMMEKQGLDPWATWSQEMEDYMMGDLDITELLWHAVNRLDISEMCQELEHDIIGVTGRMEANGFPFDVEGAQTLAQELHLELDSLKQKLIDRYGQRIRPRKKVRIAPQYYDPHGVMKAKEMKGTFAQPNPALGEDRSRTWWGEVVVPKRNMKDRVAGLPYCPAKFEYLNPTSRTQLIEILIDHEGWTPEEFSEDSGGIVLDDAVLEKLEHTIPIASDLRSIFFLQKLLGQLDNGTNSWLRSVDPDDGKIHAYTNTGGAVTGRCTHSKPNIAQVPSVVVEGLYRKDGTENLKLYDPVTKQWKPWLLDAEGNLKTKKGKPIKEGVVRGRDGEYGWECRSLFRMPPGWKQVGIDLSGIEFRCLAELCAEFDGGELIDVVLNGDIHAYNQQKTGIPTRDIVKRVLYGLLYGAGDAKLGSTAEPAATKEVQRALGARMRAQLMEGLPALNEAIKKVQKDAQRGYLYGLDGRRIRVRSEHSALNTRLQSDAALIAKRWICLTEWYAVDAGAINGWKGEWDARFNDGIDGEGDFAMLAFIHDEQQSAVAPEFAEMFAELGVKAAGDAGLDFGFQCRIDAEAKIGYSWAECH